MNPAYIYALIGGLIIGVAVSIFLLFEGRVTGISGIVNGALNPQKGDWDWRIAFVVGLIAGGFTMYSLHPEFFINTSQIPYGTLALAGLFVGFGTVMANGCTSGHGVCGISRFSIRSIVATITFIVAGATAILVRRWFL